MAAGCKRSVDVTMEYDINDFNLLSKIFVTGLVYYMII